MMHAPDLSSLVPESNELGSQFPAIPAGLAGRIRSRGLRATFETFLHQAYRGGFQGCFCRSEDAPTWAQAAADRGRAAYREARGSSGWLVEDAMPAALQGTGRGKRAVNHLYTMQKLPYGYEGSQDFGNCRAWSARDVSMTLVGMAMATGDLKRMEVRHGTALVYSYRGHSGDGMDMATGLDVLERVGQSEEKDYGGGIDLSTEGKDESAGRNWSRGAPAALVAAVKGDTIVKSWHLGEPTADLVMDTLYNEGVIDTGSTMTAGQAADGLISPLSRIGGHAQCTTLYDDTEEFRAWYAAETGRHLEEAVVGTHQSWGDWLKLSRWPTHLWGPRPEGMWIVPMSDYLKLLRDWGEGYGATGSRGFVLRRLPDWGSQIYL